ncbi:hypothetical protein [Neptunomonas sp.]|uniref:hypothetical protein n=1 Tax=Neptunomonas sp. TaxID=1971898 RepID=UPI0035649608
MQPLTSPSSSSYIRNNLKAPAEGFEWQVFDPIHFAMLKPLDWHVGISQGAHGYTGSVSLENFNESGVFSTGASVIFAESVSRLAHVPPSVLIIKAGDDFVRNKNFNIIEVQKIKDYGTYKSLIIKYRSNSEVADPTIVHLAYYAFDKEDFLYIVTFESPESTWDKYWETGKIILSNIVFYHSDLSDQVHVLP